MAFTITLANGLLINSTNAAETLEGAGGNDTINGNGGNDSLVGNTGNDRVLGGLGNDTIQGFVNGEVKGLDSLVGDIILVPIIERDTLSGGPGNDYFILGAPAMEGAGYYDESPTTADSFATITDFSPSSDVIQLSAEYAPFNIGLNLSGNYVIFRNLGGSTSYETGIDDTIAVLSKGLNLPLGTINVASPPPYIVFTDFIIWS